MSIAGRLRRVDDRVVTLGNSRFGTGPLAGVKGAAFGAAIGLLLLVVPLIAMGRDDLLWPVVLTSVVGVGIGLLVSSVVALSRALTAVSVEREQLRGEVSTRPP